MCCRFRVSGDQERLRTAFEEYALTINAVPTPTMYIKDKVTLENGDIILIWTRLDEDGEIQLWLEPGIANLAQHHLRGEAHWRLAKTAASFAARCDGKMWQLSTVAECLAKLGSRENMVANYPSEPLTPGRLCPGFQQALGLMSE